MNADLQVFLFATGLVFCGYLLCYFIRQYRFQASTPISKKKPTPWEEKSFSSSKKNLPKSTAPKARGRPHFIVFSILPKGSFGFSGATLLAALKENQFTYGIGKLFHYMEEIHQEVLCSVASLVQPGYFEYETMQEDLFPGILVWMNVSENTSGECFDVFLKHVKKLAAFLNGELCDPNRQPVTEQMLINYRKYV